MANEDSKAVAAETKRRKGIWQQMERLASKLVADLKKEGRRQGVDPACWFPDTLQFAIDFPAGRSGAIVSVCIRPDGTIYLNVPSYDAQQHGGYPFMGASAPSSFKEYARSAMTRRMNDYL